MDSSTALEQAEFKGIPFPILEMNQSLVAQNLHLKKELALATSSESKPVMESLRGLSVSRELDRQVAFLRKKASEVISEEAPWDLSDVSTMLEVSSSLCRYTGQSLALQRSDSDLFPQCTAAPEFTQSGLKGLVEKSEFLLSQQSLLKEAVESSRFSESLYNSILECLVTAESSVVALMKGRPTMLQAEYAECVYQRSVLLKQKINTQSVVKAIELIKKLEDIKQQLMSSQFVQEENLVLAQTQAKLNILVHKTANTLRELGIPVDANDGNSIDQCSQIVQNQMSLLTSHTTSYLAKVKNEYNEYLSELKELNFKVADKLGLCIESPMGNIREAIDSLGIHVDLLSHSSSDTTENISIQQELTSLKLKNSQLEKTSESFIKDAKVKDKEIEELSEELSRTGRALSFHKDMNVQLEQKMKDTQETPSAPLFSYKEENSKLISEKAKLNSEITKLNQELVKQEGWIDTLLKTKEDLCIKLEDLHRKIANETTTNLKHSRKLSEIFSNIKLLNSELTRKNVSSKYIQKIIEDTPIDETPSQTQENNFEASSVLRKDLSNKDRVIDDHLSKISEFSSIIETQQLELQSLREKYSTVTKDLKEFADLVHPHIKEVPELLSFVEKLKESERSLQIKPVLSRVKSSEIEEIIVEEKSTIARKPPLSGKIGFEHHSKSISDIDLDDRKSIRKKFEENMLELKELKNKKLVWNDLGVKMRELINEISPSQKTVEVLEKLDLVMGKSSKVRSTSCSPSRRANGDSFINHLLKNPDLLQYHFEQFHEELESKEKLIVNLKNKIKKHEDRIKKMGSDIKTLRENTMKDKPRTTRRNWVVKSRDYREEPKESNDPGLQNEINAHYESARRMYHILTTSREDALEHIKNELEIILKNKRLEDLHNMNEANLEQGLDLYKDKLEDIDKALSDIHKNVPELLNLLRHLQSDIDKMQETLEFVGKDEAKQQFKLLYERLSLLDTQLLLKGLTKGWTPLKQLPIETIDIELLEEDPAFLKGIIKQLITDIKTKDKSFFLLKEKSYNLKKIFYTFKSYIYELEKIPGIDTGLLNSIKTLCQSKTNPKKAPELAEILYNRILEKDLKIARQELALSGSEVPETNTSHLQKQVDSLYEQLRNRDRELEMVKYDYEKLQLSISTYENTVASQKEEIILLDNQGNKLRNKVQAMKGYLSPQQISELEEVEPYDDPITYDSEDFKFSKHDDLHVIYNKLSELLKSIGVIEFTETGNNFQKSILLIDKINQEAIINTKTKLWGLEKSLYMLEESSQQNSKLMNEVKLLCEDICRSAGEEVKENPLEMLQTILVSFEKSRLENEEHKRVINNLQTLIAKESSNYKELKESFVSQKNVLESLQNTKKPPRSRKTEEKTKKKLKSTEKHLKKSQSERSELLWVLNNIRTYARDAEGKIQEIISQKKPSSEAIRRVKECMNNITESIEEHPLLSSSGISSPIIEMTSESDPFDGKIETMVKEHEELSFKNNSLKCKISSLKNEYDERISSFEINKEQLAKELRDTRNLLDTSGFDLSAADTQSAFKIVFFIGKYKLLKENNAFLLWKTLKKQPIKNKFPQWSSVNTLLAQEKTSSEQQAQFKMLIAEDMLKTVQENPLSHELNHSAAPTDYLYLFSTIEDLMEHKHRRDLSDLNKGIAPRHYRDYIYEYFNDIPRLQSFMSTLKSLVESSHPYACFASNLLNVFSDSPIPLHFAAFITSFRANLQELVTKADVIREKIAEGPRDLSVDSTLYSFERAGHGGLMLLTDVVDVVYSLFGDCKEGGVFVLQRLCPDKISIKDFLGFLISHKIQQHSKAPLDILVKLHKPKSSLLSATDIIRICEGEDVWVSHSLILKVFTREMKQSDFCSWVSVTNYVKCKTNMSYTVTKCKVFKLLTDFFNFLQVRDGAKLLANLISNYTPEFQKEEFLQFIRELHIDSKAVRDLYKPKMTKEELCLLIVKEGIAGYGIGPFCMKKMFNMMVPEQDVKSVPDVSPKRIFKGIEERKKQGSNNKTLYHSRRYR